VRGRAIWIGGEKKLKHKEDSRCRQSNKPIRTSKCSTDSGRGSGSDGGRGSDAGRGQSLEITEKICADPTLILSY